jgi:ubiquinone/menaquinone biosynthesis C-methylase UbiE
MSYKFLPERTRRKNYTPRLEQSVYFVVKHLHDFIISSLHQYVRANSTVVDIGCGEQPMRTLIEEKGAQYIGVDIVQNSQNTVDIVCSGASIQLPDNSVECILCTEVVEHVPEIDKVFSEFTRILKPNGYIILTCPFLYPLHEEPHDFNRPTPYLLEFLANKYSLTVLKLEKTGNGIECIATILDVFFEEYKSNSNKVIQILWDASRFCLRLSVNSIAIILSSVFGKINRIKKTIYLSNLAIFQKIIENP